MKMKLPLSSSEQQLELIKWLALLCMLLDHLGFIFGTGTPYLVLRLIGRLCWPLILWLTFERLEANSARVWGYLRRLLPWAILSQPFYWAMLTLHNQSLQMFDQINIFSSLFLGITAYGLLTLTEGKQRLLIIPGLVVLAIAGLRSDFGPIGVLSLPMLALVVRHINPKLALYGVGLLGSIAGSLTVLLSAGKIDLPQLVIFSFGPLLAIPAIAITYRFNVVLPRLKQWAFYAFYPAHMLVLVGLLAWIQGQN